jgi:hypothetical protein
MDGRSVFRTRGVLIAFVVATGWSGMSARGSASAATAGLAGHWRVTYYLQCADATHNAQLCAAAVQIKLPIADEKGASFVTQRTLDMVSDARGRFTFQSTIVTIEQAHGSTERCHSYQEDIGTLMNICEMTSQGRGHIAKGETGKLDFWVEQRTTTYHGTRLYKITRSAVLDTLTPATPGCLDTPVVLKLHGFPAAPPGLVARISIVHGPAGALHDNVPTPLQCGSASA